MEGFTLIDGVVAGVIIISAVLAYARGLVREVMAIFGWIAAAIAAYVFAPALQPFMQEIPVVGDYLDDSCELSVIGAFAVIFAIGLVVAAFFTPLFSSAVRRSALGGVDMGLGFIFGAARGVLLVAIALIAFNAAVTPGSMPMVEESRSAAIFERLQANIEESLPEDAPNWIIARYEALVSVCFAEA